MRLFAKMDTQDQGGIQFQDLMTEGTQGSASVG